MANTPGAGIMPAAKKSKEEVNYRHQESCSSCDHFWAATNVCDLVSGNIGDTMLCNLYALRSQEPVAKDGSFYQAQFNKAQVK